MKAAPKQNTTAAKHTAIETGQSSWQNQSAQVANNSPQAVTQRAFIAGINHSPRMTAQRKQIESYIGIDQQPIQRLEKPDDPEQQALPGKVASASSAQLQASPPKPNNTGLPDPLKAGIESLSGLSVDNVNVHYNSSQPAQLNALAYAQGSDIHIAPGQEQHLPHEAWHVVQQAQGRVKPTMQMKGGININDDASLEKEADTMGKNASQYTNCSPQNLIQRKLSIINKSQAYNSSTAIQLTKYPNTKALKDALLKSDIFSYLSQSQKESVALEFPGWYSRTYGTRFATVDIVATKDQSIEDQLKILIDKMINEIDSFTDTEGQALTDMINQAPKDHLVIGFHAGGKNKPDSKASKPFGDIPIKSQIGGDGYYIAKDLEIAKEYANQYIIQGMIANIQEVSLNIKMIKQTLLIKGVSVTEWWDKYNGVHDQTYDLMVAKISGKTGNVQYKLNPKHKESGLLVLKQIIETDQIIAGGFNSEVQS